MRWASEVNASTSPNSGIPLLGPVPQDVVTYLSWAAEPEADERKLMGAKWIAVLSLVGAACSLPAAIGLCCQCMTVLARHALTCCQAALLLAGCGCALGQATMACMRFLLATPVPNCPQLNKSLLPGGQPTHDALESDQER